MNERLPYEEQLALGLHNLPLLDESLAWADMKRRLDDEDDSTPVWWRRVGCLLSGLLLAGILGAGWLLLKPSKWFNKGEQGVSIKKQTNNNKETQNSSGLPDSVYYNAPGKTVLSDIGKTEDGRNSKETTISAPTVRNTISKKIVASPQSKQKKTKRNSISTSTEDRVPDGKEPNHIGMKNSTLSDPVEKDIHNETLAIVSRNNDSTQMTTIVKIELTDTLLVKNTEKSSRYIVEGKKADTSVLTPVINNQKLERDSSAKHEAPREPFVWSVGLSIYQQLPIAGQKMVPYSSAGRRLSIADYIPAPYIRLEKDKKWFLQTEFRYGAPQYTNEFIFRQVSTPDTGTTPQFTTVKTSSLKKTFYHQLPLTFHYYIMPGWSLGAGLQWNKFGGAVYEQQDIKRNNFTQQDSLLSKKILSESSDSLYEFKKSYFQAVIETQYQWRKFSFGARYAFGLEPYIKFSLPGGVNQEERNNVVQAFLRYQLWKNNKNK